MRPHFFHLVRQQVDAPRLLALVLAQALQFAHRCGLAHQLTHLLPGRSALHNVQQTDVLVAQQRQVLALAVDIHEQPGNLAQQRAVVTVRPLMRATERLLGPDLAAEHHDVRLVAFQVVLGQQAQRPARPATAGVSSNSP